MRFTCLCKGQEGRHFSLNQGHYKRLKQEGEAATRTCPWDVNRHHFAFWCFMRGPAQCKKSGAQKNLNVAIFAPLHDTPPVSPGNRAPRRKIYLYMAFFWFGFVGNKWNIFHLPRSL